MRKAITYLALTLVCSALLIALSANGIQAAPQHAVAANFGMMMKPGWGGGDDGVNITMVLLLRCALLKQYQDRLPGQQSVPLGITGGMRSATCATFPMKGMGDGSPIGVGFQFVPYAGRTDVFPQRYDPVNPQADR
jgi:hypothetical protein